MTDLKFADGVAQIVVPVFPLMNWDEPYAAVDIAFCDGDCIRGPHERGRHYQEIATVLFKRPVENA